MVWLERYAFATVVQWFCLEAMFSLKLLLATIVLLKRFNGFVYGNDAFAEAFQ